MVETVRFCTQRRSLRFQPFHLLVDLEGQPETDVIAFSQLRQFNILSNGDSIGLSSRCSDLTRSPSPNVGYQVYPVIRILLDASLR